MACTVMFRDLAFAFKLIQTYCVSFEIRSSLIFGKSDSPISHPFSLNSGGLRQQVLGGTCVDC